MRFRRPGPRWLAAGAALWLLAGCAATGGEPSPDTRTAPTEDTPATAAPVPSEPGPSSSGPSSSGPSSSGRAPRVGSRVEARDLVEGLTSPWGLLPLADGSVLVSERDTGAILRVRDGRATRLAMLDGVRPGGEGGLLGLAVTPKQDRVFAYFTAAEDNRVVAMAFDGRALGRPEVILQGIPKAWRHNGGRLAVGPDGYLYVSTGDAGESSHAQDRTSLGGKILRVTFSGKPAPGNPFDSAVWSSGHRNVEGLAFDDRGRLWASEFGDQTWDELNLITKGANYGWPEVEGSGKVKGMTNPKLVWRTSQASPSGLAFWQGELWMGALRGERLWEIPLRDGEVGDPVGHLSGDLGRLRSVAATPDGRRLLLTTSNTDGRGDARRGDDRILVVTR